MYDAVDAVREGARLRHGAGQDRHLPHAPRRRFAFCDWIRVSIDSYHDKRTAYEFAVNPSGVKNDRYWFNDNNRDDSWDAVWDVASRATAQGWSAEFRIPFSQLRFNPARRIRSASRCRGEIGRLKETSTWPLLSRSATGYVSSFGELGGLSMAASPKRLESAVHRRPNLTRQPPAAIRW